MDEFSTTCENIRICANESVYLKTELTVHYKTSWVSELISKRLYALNDDQKVRLGSFHHSTAVDRIHVFQ